MGAYDNGFGVDLITTWFCSLLAGVGLTQAVRYFAKFPNDILFKKGLVGVVLFLLFLEVAMECASSYTMKDELLTSSTGNPTAFTIVYAGAILCTSVIAFIVDQFLIHRFYGLSKNIWVAIILSLFNLVSFVMGLIIVQFFASKVGSTISLAELHDTVTPVTTALSTMSVVTDVTIAASLVWTLRGMKTSFKNTNQLIQHIVAISIQNGCTTSAVAIAGMVAQLVAPATRIDDFFFGLLGPLYLLTVLSNLTLRESAPPSSGWSSSGEIGGSRNNQLPFGGVHVRRSVTTTGGTSTDFGAAYDDTTVRGTSDDVEAGRKEFEDASSADQNAEKIQFRAN
ncbi:hypothetical protein C8R46DRAFT_1059850 [Mycena filopes]|nr:hypothetical protein C8R46DRAFT_1059850 [Mycena filopes]